MKRDIPTKNGDGDAPEVFLRLYDAHEVAAILGVSLRFVLCAKKNGAPFYHGKTRLEWFLEWLKKNVNDEARRRGCCNECMYYRPRNAEVEQQVNS